MHDRSVVGAVHFTQACTAACRLMEMVRFRLAGTTSDAHRGRQDKGGLPRDRYHKRRHVRLRQEFRAALGRVQLESPLQMVHSRKLGN